MSLRRKGTWRQRGGAWSAGFVALCLLLGSAPLTLLAENATAPKAPQPPQPPRAMPYPTAPDSCRRCFVQTKFLAKLQTLPVEADRVEVSHGVGIFYTTENSKYVNAVRSLVGATIDGLHAVTENPDKAHLCLNCKRDYRIYSKFEHEVVPLDQGVLVLITSKNDEATDILKKWYLPRRTYIDIEELERRMEEFRREAEKLRVNGGR
jgi:hypothetical protein